MTGENGEIDDVDPDDIDDIEDEDMSSDEMPDIGGDTVLDVSGELKALVDTLDKGDPDEAAHRREVHRRLEELRDKRDEDLDSTYNFNMDEDI